MYLEADWSAELPKEDGVELYSHIMGVILEDYD